MIRVTVELISAVHPSRSRCLGVAEICNTGTGTATTGNYEARLSKSGTQTKQTWRRAFVQGFPRKRLGGWDLLYRVLRDAVGSRNEGDRDHRKPLQPGEEEASQQNLEL